MIDRSSLAVVILNFDGRHHLGPCLEAVLALDGLPGPGSVVVADNGSTDDSAAFVRSTFPGVTWLPLGRNRGFAAGNDQAAEAVDGEWLLFLNNDTAIAPDALVVLRSAVTGGATCAGARLVTWDGRWLDFDGGGASFTGHGHALGIGQPVPRYAEPPRPTLFASGAAMLVRREAFLSLGGFDPAYFAYYEDVDLGWRLWLAGHEVIHVPAAVVRHRHHGTVGAVAGRATRLYERNALATVTKVYGDDLLPRVLPAALALAAVRAGAPATVIDGADPSSSGGLPLPVDTWPGWAALAPLTLDWSALGADRERVQATRRRPDAAILPLLARALAPVPPTGAMRAAVARAVAYFGLNEVIPPDVAGGASRSRAARLRRLTAVTRVGGATALARAIRAYYGWRRGGGR